MKTHRSVLMLLLGAALLGGVAVAAPMQNQKTRATMLGIFSDVRLLLPLAVKDEGFADKARAPEISAALAGLADNATFLESHTGGMNPGATFEGRSLADDAREIQRRFALGQTTSSQTLFLEMTQHCVACHALLPSTDSALTERLVSQSTLMELPPVERARIQIATRQFTGALSTWEALLRDPGIDPMNLRDPLRDYIATAIRVEHEPGRVKAAVAALAKRDHLGIDLGREVRAYQKTVDAITVDTLNHGDLKKARELVEEGERMSGSPRDRSGLLHYAAASAIAHRLIESGLNDDAKLAEAYTLVVKADFRIDQSYPVVLAERYLESAIRLAPGSRTAQDAHAMLRLVIRAAHTGPSSSVVPFKQRMLLDELGALAYGK